MYERRDRSAEKMDYLDYICQTFRNKSPFFLFPLPVCSKLFVGAPGDHDKSTPAQFEMFVPVVPIIIYTICLVPFAGGFFIVQHTCSTDCTPGLPHTRHCRSSCQTCSTSSSFCDFGVGPIDGGLRGLVAYVASRCEG